MDEEYQNQLRYLKRLVEALTTSGKPSLNEKEMKALKQICKSSNNYVVHLYELLMKQLKKKHAEIRLSSFQVCDEIFMRSHCLRQLISDNIDNIYNLTILIDNHGPSLKPVDVAKKLKTTAILTIAKWHEKFGDGYIYLRMAYKYLKDCEGVDFEGATISTEESRRRREEETRKYEEIKNMRIQKVVSEMDDKFSEISHIILESNSTFKLLIPDLDNFFISTENDNLDNLCSDERINNDDYVNHSFEYGSDLMRRHGLTKETLVQINLSDIHEVQETVDNEIVISSIKEQVSTIENNVMPKVKSWEQSVMPYSSSQQELTQKIIDIKRSLESIISRFHTIKILPRKNGKAIDKEIDKISATEYLSDDDDNDDDFIDVPFDDPRVIQAAASEAALLETLNSSLKEKLRNAKINPDDIIAAGSSGLKQGQSVRKKIDKDLSIDKFVDDNMQKPTIFCNSMPGITNIWSANEVLHDHGDGVLKSTDVLGIATRIIDIEREWEPVRWECRAPLPSGRLCPRKDRECCPLHGPVIQRNNLGEPVNPDDKRKEQQRREDYERAHPAWQDPTLLAEIRASTGVDLDMKKSKKRKRKYPNLTNIKELANTPKKRLEKKIFSKKSVRRLNKALSKIPQ